MADIGLNQNISVKNRQFHIQTASNIDEGFIQTEVFEKGRLLFVENSKYERRAPSKEAGANLRVRKLLDQYHQSIISGLEILFELSTILETVPHQLSHHRIGAIFLSLHLYDKAEYHLQKAINLDQEKRSPYLLLSRCYYLQKRYQQASQILDPLLRLEVGYPDLYNLKGLILLEQKNYTKAMNHFRKAIKLNPEYIEAYYNLATAILMRIGFLKMENKLDEIKKNFEFFSIVLRKINKIGDNEDKKLILSIKQSLTNKKFGNVQTQIYDYRHKRFYQRIPEEISGYEFYLWLRYLPERLDYEALKRFKERISRAVELNSDFPDMWSFLSLIHLMMCRDYFLKGLDNFKEATKINPRFSKAKKNLKLVENDGREFLFLIKAIIKD